MELNQISDNGRIGEWISRVLVSKALIGIFGKYELRRKEQYFGFWYNVPP